MTTERTGKTMPQSEILRANFTISSVAKDAIERLRVDFDAESSDPAAVLWVAWGISVPPTGPRPENVMISFYPRSMLAEVSFGIQEVSGVKLIFFTTEEYLDRFEEKVLDYSDSEGFFMRSQANDGRGA